MPRVINIFTLGIASWLLVIGIIMAVWHILDDRSTDIAVPDDSVIARREPNPPMPAWRPRLPDSVGTVQTSYDCTGENSSVTMMCRHER